MPTISFVPNSIYSILKKLNCLGRSLQGNSRLKARDFSLKVFSMKQVYLDTFGCQMNVAGYGSYGAIVVSFGLYSYGGYERCGSDSHQHVLYPGKSRAENLLHDGEPKAAKRG